MAPGAARSASIAVVDEDHDADVAKELLFVNVAVFVSVER